jgi:hypothetical protein
MALCTVGMLLIVLCFNSSLTPLSLEQAMVTYSKLQFSHQSGIECVFLEYRFQSTHLASNSTFTETVAVESTCLIHHRRGSIVAFNLTDYGENTTM